MVPTFPSLLRKPLLVVGLIGSTFVVSTVDGDDPADAIIRSRLVEKTGRHLVQLDVSVRGPEDAIANLTAADFELVVGGDSVSEFTLDRMCGEAGPSTDADTGRSAASTGAPPPEPEGWSLLFYFDQFHLRHEGRARAIALSRELIPKLVTGANRAMIVSSARQLRTFQDWTSDPQRLLEAIDELEADESQHDPYPSMEEQRVDQVYAALAGGLNDAAPTEGRLHRKVAELSEKLARIDAKLASGPSKQERRSMSKAQRNAYIATRQQLVKLANGYRGQIALHKETAEQFQSSSTIGAEAAARRFQQEERWQAQRALSRFSATLARFSDTTPPKAVIYFADTVRPNPGDHYLGLVGVRTTAYRGSRVFLPSYPSNPRESVRDLAPGSNRVSSQPVQGAMPTSFHRVDARGSSSPYEGVINEAAVHGVRLYTVQAEGLVASVTPGRMPALSMSRQVHDPMAGRRRLDDAKSGLVGFALETGGQAFLGANDADRIARGILDDLSCPFLISFDPQGLPEDRELPVRLWTDVPDLELRYRTRVVARSEAAVRESQLSTAFLSAELADSDSGIRIAVVPTGFSNGKYTALVQVIARGSELANATWDLGATLLVEEKIKHQDSGRLSINRPHVPVVFETEVKLVPGSFRVVAVGHQIETDTVVSTQIDDAWPEPPSGPSIPGPIAIVQLASGAFLRAGELRRRGSLAIGPDGWVDADLPSALMSLACRAKSGKVKNRPLVVERQLTGQSVTELEPARIELDGERCSLLADRIEPGTLTGGSFRYDSRIVGTESEVARASRSFVAVSPEDIALARHSRE